MKGKKTSRTESSSITASVAIGLLASVILTVLLAMIVAVLVLNGTLEETTVGYMCMAILLVATVVGTVLAGKKATGKYGIICISVAVGFVLVMIGSNIIFFDGVFMGFMSKIAMVLLGCGLASVVLLKPLGKGKRKRYRR